MDVERNLGPQPIAEVLEQLGLTPHHLVEASPDQLTHKMVQRAVKGRRLTDRTKAIVIRALNAASESSFKSDQLFNY